MYSSYLWTCAHGASLRTCAPHSSSETCSTHTSLETRTSLFLLTRQSFGDLACEKCSPMTTRRNSRVSFRFCRVVSWIVLGLYFVFMFIALRHTSTISTSAIFALMPFSTLILDSLFFNKKSKTLILIVFEIFIWTISSKLIPNKYLNAPPVSTPTAYFEFEFGL